MYSSLIVPCGPDFDPGRDHQDIVPAVIPWIVYPAFPVTGLDPGNIVLTASDVAGNGQSVVAVVGNITFQTEPLVNAGIRVKKDVHSV